MRLTTNRPRIGALLFLPFALALGCNRPPAPPPPAALNYKDVIVTLELQPDGKLMPIPDFKKLKLSKNADDRAHWKYCGDGKLEIKMKQDGYMPFEGLFHESETGNCKHVHSTKISPAAVFNTPYPYTITVTAPNTKPNDPDIEIMQ